MGPTQSLRPGAVGCIVRSVGGDVESVVLGSYPEHQREAGQRRRSFVEENPGMPGPIKALVSEGWVQVGMRMSEVEASWGEPAHVHGEAWTFRRTDRPYTLRFKQGVLVRIN